MVLAEKAKRNWLRYSIVGLLSLGLYFELVLQVRSYRRYAAARGESNILEYDSSVGWALKKSQTVENGLVEGARSTHSA